MNYHSCSHEESLIRGHTSVRVLPNGGQEPFPNIYFCPEHL
jgi:hypothetical protein